MPTKTFIIAGVPEYFNLPILQAIESGAFEEQGLKVEWKETPEGTGAMAQALWEETVDMAIILTEGVVKSMAQGNPARIVKTFVESPLIWGIHVPAAGGLQTEAEIEGQPIAVSRMGSGSHMMAALHAQQRGWDTASQDFRIVNNLKGAIAAFEKGEASVFFWEKFTTKPWVDDGTFRRVGEFPTPWPCFVVATTANVLREHAEAVRAILGTINQFAQQLMEAPQAVEHIAERFSLDPADVKQFFPVTQWNTGWEVPIKSIPQVLRAFSHIGLIDSEAMPLENFIHDLT